VWLIDDQARTAGYVVLTLKFGVEYGGLMACIDDLFGSSAKPQQGVEHGGAGRGPRLLHERRNSRNYSRGGFE
jgi:hypothetical protein